MNRIFLKAHFVQTLLLTAIIDADERNLLFVWAVMKSKSQNSWEYFLSHLWCAISKVQNCTLMSDRDKELLHTDAMLSSWVIKAYCCHYLLNNFMKKFRRVLRFCFWAIAQAKTAEAFKKKIRKLQKVKPAAEDWLQQVVSASFLITTLLTVYCLKLTTLSNCILFWLSLWSWHV